MQRLAEAEMTATDSGRTSLGRRAFLAITSAAIGLACAGRAHADTAPVDLQVVDRETGQPLRVWPHDGRLFVAGSPGDRYSLRVTNQTDSRVLVVMSVDGVNILTGETAGYGQRGYIFGPHESYDLNGWRKSLTEVADFTFDRLSKSYAALTGRPEDVGVIGIAVFDEKIEQAAAVETPPPAPPPDDERGAADSATGRALSENVPPPLALREAPAPPPPPPQYAAGGADNTSVTDIVVTAEKRGSRRAPAAVSAFTSRSRDAAEAEARDEKLGTGHGAREWSVMTIEPFERATPWPQFTQQIEYDTRDHLVAMGVIPTWRYGERRPRPFPSSPDGAGFVPDPPDDP
jgi:hypothetical protein